MAIKINIQNTSKITYRTDCLADDFDYHIRDHSQYDYEDVGYLPKISGTISEAEQKTYDVGYNPSGTDPLTAENPIVCDRIICNALFKSPSAITDIPYSELRFQQAAIALKENVSTSGKRISTDTFELINRIYGDIANNCIKASGTRYTNGQGVIYNDVFESPPGMRYRTITELRMTIHKGYVLSLSEIQDMFENTDHTYQVWSELSGMTYGALVIELLSGAIARGNYTVRFFAQTPEVDIELTPSNSEPSEHRYLMIPFISADEYNAAKAASYKWDAETIEEIDDIL